MQPIIYDLNTAIGIAAIAARARAQLGDVIADVLEGRLMLVLVMSRPSTEQLMPDSVFDEDKARARRRA